MAGTNLCEGREWPEQQTLPRGLAGLIGTAVDRVPAPVPVPPVPRKTSTPALEILLLVHSEVCAKIFRLSTVLIYWSPTVTPGSSTGLLYQKRGSGSGAWACDSTLNSTQLNSTQLNYELTRVALLE